MVPERSDLTPGGFLTVLSKVFSFLLVFVVSVKWAKNGGDIKLKVGTKTVAMRGQKLSTPRFCTEFRCESNHDDGISPNPLF